MMALVWSNCVKGGPERVNHAAAVVGNHIYSFGGYSPEYSTLVSLDVYVFCTVTKKWRVLETPTDPDELMCVPFQRYGHTAVAHGTNIYIWGGKNDAVACNTLHCFDTVLQKWSCPYVEGSIPGARDGHTACILDDKMYIIGGFHEDFTRYADGIYALDLNTMKWSHIVTKGEEIRYMDFHGTAVVNGKIYVFGGRGGVNGRNYTQAESYNNDMYIFDPQSSTWTKKSSPKAPIGRRSLGMVAYENRLYIIGGYNGNYETFFNDVHCYDTLRDEWSGELKTYGLVPSKRRRHCTVVHNDHIILFGGTSPVENYHNVSNYYLQGEYLRNHDDLYILNLKPSLATLCMAIVIKHNLDISSLPVILQREIIWMKSESNVQKEIGSSSYLILFNGVTDHLR